MFKRFRWVVCVGLLACVSMHVNAQQTEAIWHCSKAAVADSAEPEAQGDFGMGAVSSGNGTIAVTMDDLLSVYSGYPVRISTKPLFACFMPGDEALSLSALRSLGLSSPALQILARRSAIVQRQLKVVTDEDEMRQCMTRHFPSFGYLSQAYVSDKVAPCF
jgi:hypothetical protein